VKELFHVETERVSFTLDAPEARTRTASSGERPAGELRILPRRPGLELQPSTHRLGVPDLAARDLSEIAGPCLFEETSYTLLLASKDGSTVELRHRDPLLLANLRSTRDGTQQYGTINFRSQVGRSRFSAFVGGRPEMDLEVEVYPSKIEYRADYAAMIGEVQDLAAGLALEYLRATHHLGASTGSRQGSRLDWIALLRHLIGDLKDALDHVARRPIRGLRREPRMVRIEALRRSDGSVRKAVRSGAGQGQRVTLTSGIAVRRYLPERRPETTLDTPEHRWLATQLQQVRVQLARLASEEQGRQRTLVASGHRLSARDTQSVEELIQLEGHITRCERAEPLAATEGLPPSGFTSLQLHAAPGYREAYRTLTILRQGLRISGGPIEVSVKDLHVLYEYWCFLGIVRLVSEIVETPIPAEHLLEVRSEGLRIRLQKGRTQVVPFELPGGRSLEVTYNPSFRDPDVLLPQQPDIVLTLTDPHWPTVRLVLDAKYRVEDDAAFVERFGAPGPPADAVNVLHRYRDAILDAAEGTEAVPGTLARRRTVIEGAALYPLGAEASAEFDRSRFWRSLERLGIGALPFLPGSQAWLEQWLRKVLTRSGWSVADAVVAHAAEEREEVWKRAAETPVLIGILRGSGIKQHRDWVQERRLYYTPLTKSQPRQLQTTHVALYEPTALFDRDQPGRVQRFAPVEDIDVVRRRDIVTPWGAGRGVDELQVVYRLGPFLRLDQPIVNRDADGRGQRVSINRWTSLLALRRATDLTELLLESMAEWRIVDALRAMGIPFQLRAIPPGEEVGQRGRTWFITGDLRMRWSGGEDVEVVRGGRSEFMGLIDLGPALLKRRANATPIDFSSDPGRYP
jgi:hypothetical protein